MSLLKKYLKIIILGNGGVGKTSLMNRYLYNTFIEKYRPTIGVEFLTNDIVVDDSVVTLQIWDTSGRIEFPHLIALFCHEADCCIFVYDVSDSDSFNALNNRRDEFLAEVCPTDPDDFPFAVIGNKIDRDDRTISAGEALEWCDSKNMIPYFETTAKDANANVEIVFQALARKAIRNLTDEKLSQL